MNISELKAHERVMIQNREAFRIDFLRHLECVNLHFEHG